MDSFYLCLTVIDYEWKNKNKKSLFTMRNVRELRANAGGELKRISVNEKRATGGAIQSWCGECIM